MTITRAPRNGLRNVNMRTLVGPSLSLCYKYVRRVTVRPVLLVRPPCTTATVTFSDSMHIYNGYNKIVFVYWKLYIKITYT